jgi:hypothetical protein
MAPHIDPRSVRLVAGVSDSMPRAREISLLAMLGENEDDCTIRGWGQTCGGDGKLT